MVGDICNPPLGRLMPVHEFEMNLGNTASSRPSYIGRPKKEETKTKHIKTETNDQKNEKELYLNW